MVIRRPIALLVNEYIHHWDSKDLVKSQKEIQNFFKNYENSRVEAKKGGRFLENEFFVHWASFDCKQGLYLTEPQFEK